MQIFCVARSKIYETLQTVWEFHKAENIQEQLQIQKSVYLQMIHVTVRSELPLVFDMFLCSESHRLSLAHSVFITVLCFCSEEFKVELLRMPITAGGNWLGPGPQGPQKVPGCAPLNWLGLNLGSCFFMWCFCAGLYQHLGCWRSSYSFQVIGLKHHMVNHFLRSHINLSWLYNNG